MQREDSTLLESFSVANTECFKNELLGNYKLDNQMGFSYGNAKRSQLAV